MKRWNNVAGILWVVAVAVFGFAADGFATETAQGWRKTYDIVLMWMNFAILAFIIVKYARIPLKEFVFRQQKDLIRELEQKEAQKNAIREKVDAVIAELKENETRIEELKERIIEQGRKKRQQIIEDAAAKSRQMLADVQVRMENRMVQARNKLRSEILEIAVDLAMDKLPQIVDEGDNQKFIESFLSGTAVK